MLNQVVIVGRIYSLKENVLTIASTKSEKNEKGEYDTNYIRFILPETMRNNVNGYCKKGDIVGVKGHIENGNCIIADKISFLSSRASQK